jgi:hypothetical protein
MIRVSKKMLSSIARGMSLIRGVQPVKSDILVSFRNSLACYNSCSSDSWIKRHFSTSNDAELKSFTVVQLRELLRTSGLPVSGRKEVLIERLKLSPQGLSLARPLQGQQPDDKNKDEPDISNTAIPAKKSPQRKSPSIRAKESRDMHAFLHARLRSLYRRCLRSADECPTDEWARALRHYVNLRFRSDPASGTADKLAVAIANGEAELAQMEIYHKAREARDLQRQLEEGATGQS